MRIITKISITVRYTKLGNLNCDIQNKKKITEDISQNV